MNKEVALAPMTNHEMNGSVVEPSVIKGVPSETSRWDQTIKEANEVEMIDVTKEINVSIFNFLLYIFIKFDYSS